MNDLNTVTMIGRLTADPQLKQTQGGGQICSFSVACNHSYSRSNGEKVEEVSYFNCTAFGKIGEVLNRYAEKGKQVAVEGRLKQRRWQDDSGKNHSAVEVVVENFQLIGSRNDNDIPV